MYFSKYLENDKEFLKTCWTKKCLKSQDLSFDIKQKGLIPYIRGQKGSQDFQNISFTYQYFVTIYRNRKVALDDLILQIHPLMSNVTKLAIVGVKTIKLWHHISQKRKLFWTKVAQNSTHTNMHQYALFWLTVPLESCWVGPWKVLIQISRKR